MVFRRNGVGLAEASEPSLEASHSEKEHFTPLTPSGGATDDSPGSSLKFSKEYLAEVREMEAALQGGAGGFDDDDDVDDDGRGSSSSSSRTTVQKKFWGRKEERVDDLAFVLSPAFSPMSMMFNAPGGGEAGGKRRKRGSGMSGTEDDDYDDEEEEDDIRMDAEGKHQYVFPMVFGNMFTVESSQRLRRAHRRRPPTYQEDYLQEEEEVVVGNETLDHHGNNNNAKTSRSSSSSRPRGGDNAYSGKEEDGVGGIEDTGYIYVDSPADMEYVNSHLNSPHHSAKPGTRGGEKKEKEEERRRSGEGGGGGGWGTPRPPAQSGRGGGSLRESQTFSERGWLRKQLAQAREKPHEDGCYTATMEFLHRVHKTRLMVEEAFIDAQSRTYDLVARLQKWKGKVRSVIHPYPPDVLSPPPPPPPPLTRESNTKKEVQEGEEEEEEEGKKVDASSSSFSSSPSTPAPPPPQEDKIKGNTEIQNAIRVEQWEMSIRYNQRKLEAARSALKEFDERTWSGLGAKLAPRCLGEAARYRFYLLHRELPSMTVAPLPPPLIFSDSNGNNDDNDDGDNVGEDGEDDAEAERRWLEKEMDKEEDDVDDDEEEAPDMIQEKMWLSQRLRESRRAEREQRREEKRRKATREGVGEEEDEEDEVDEAKEEEELEQLANGKFKKFLQDRVRERRQLKREAVRKRLLEEWRSRRKKTSSSSSKDGGENEKGRRRRGKTNQGHEPSLLLNTAKRSKNTLDHSVKAKPLKETEYMTFSQVLQQCKVFARNQVYGAVLPPLYLFWQLSTAFFRFYLDELNLPFFQPPQTCNSSNRAVATSPLDAFVVDNDNNNDPHPRKREAEWNDPAHHALHLPDATIPPPPPFYGPEDFVLCSERRSPSFQFLSLENERHVLFLSTWPMMIGVVILGVIVAPLVIFNIFFKEFMINFVGYRFFLQYVLRLRQDPLTVLRNALVEELMRRRNPSEALRVGQMWYRAVIETFHHHDQHPRGNIQRWWNWKSEEFLCLSFIVVSIIASWFVWRGCNAWMRFFLFRWSVIAEQDKSAQEEEKQKQKREGGKRAPSTLPPHPPEKKKQPQPSSSPSPLTQEHQSTKKEKKQKQKHQGVKKD